MKLPFKKFLLERDLTAEKALPSAIKTRISNFLNSVEEDAPLWRGIKRSVILNSKPVAEIQTDIPTEIQGVNCTIKVYEFVIPRSRKPVSMDDHLAKLVDDWFEKTHGMRVRSQSMFCVATANNVNIATEFVSSYGVPCAVAPAGNFTYVWSPVYDDLYFSLLYSSKEEAEARVESDLERANYQVNTGLVEVPSEHEIMVQGSTYYAFVMFEHSSPITFMTAEQQKTLAKVMWK